MIQKKTISQAHVCEIADKKTAWKEGRAPVMAIIYVINVFSIKGMTILFATLFNNGLLMPARDFVTFQVW